MKFCIVLLEVFIIMNAIKVSVTVVAIVRTLADHSKQMKTLKNLLECHLIINLLGFYRFSVLMRLFIDYKKLTTHYKLVRLVSEQ